MKKRQLSLILAAMICTYALSSCSDSRSETAAGAAGTSAATTTERTNTTPAATLAEEDAAALAEGAEDVEKLENPTVSFLSSWDINPANGKPKTPALEMFESQYGGKIEYHQCTWEARYDELGKLVAAGDSPDMFSAEDLDVFPKGVIKGMFQPLDKYIDFDSELWAPMKETNELFALNGKHYVGAYNTNAGVVMIYNKRVMEENGLTDPAELLADGNWTWDTFYDMMMQFCDRSNEKFAIDGWWFEGAFSLTSGVPYIGIKDGKIVQNLSDPMIEKVQEYFLKIKNEDMPFPKSEYGWQIYPQNIKDGKTLFYPCGIWALEDLDLLDSFGETRDDIGFVPMPRCPHADAYYLPTAIYGFSLIAGAPNPEGTAAYIDCCMRCRDNEAAKEISRKQLFDDYGWTQEMYDMLETTRELTEKHPIIEYYTAVNDNVNDLINNPMKESYNAGVAWAQTRETIKGKVQQELDSANKELENR